MRCCVLGAGSWGTALASLLAGKGFPVTAWDKDTVVLEEIARTHHNERYLPGTALPATLLATPDLHRALEGAELVVMAVPSFAVRQVAIEAKRLIHAGTPIVCVAKGIELETLMTMTEVMEDVLPVPLHPYMAVMSGPSFAREVARGLPTAVTVAARWERIARQVQDAFHTRTFRPYTSGDVMGCEIGGCVKNVVAIAAGIADGLGFGANALAALITRGLAEITRMAVRKGANPLTLSGLSGLGDLVLDLLLRSLPQPDGGPAAGRGPEARGRRARDRAGGGGCAERPERARPGPAARGGDAHQRDGVRPPVRERAAARGGHRPHAAGDQAGT